MVNAQEWLDKNYPKSQRKDIKSLDLRNKGLEKILDLRDFTNLESLDCTGNSDLTDVLLPNTSSLNQIAFPSQWQQGQNWKNIHPYFTLKLQEEWENRGFSHDQAKKLIGTGVHPGNYNAAVYFRWKGYNSQQLLDINQYKKIAEEYNNWIKNIKKVQDYLDLSYPSEVRNKIKKIDLHNLNLEGNLELGDFVNLEKLNCASNHITELKFNNCSNLQVVNCCYNKLTNLNLTNCYSLNELYCANNFLTKLDFLNDLSADKLEMLNLDDNNFSEQDLSVFNGFAKLRFLGIGSNNKEKIEKNIYNRFVGSLEPLKSLTNLKVLHINNTDIEEGVEYLPQNLEKIYCRRQQRPEAKVGQIEKLLKNMDILYGHTTQGWEWLDEIYPSRQKVEILYPNKQNVELIDLADLKNPEQEIELVIAKFPQLKEIKKSGLNLLSNVTKITISECPDLKIIKNNNQSRVAELSSEKAMETLERMKLEIKLDQQEWFEHHPLESELKEENKQSFSNQSGIIQELNVQNCPNLKILDISYSKLTTLNLSQFPNLEVLKIAGNALINLDIQNNQKLRELDISDTKLDILDINHLTKLEELNVSKNKLTNLGLSCLVNLKKLDCAWNLLTNLDLSKNLQLEELNVINNDFSRQGLNFLKHLINLRRIDLGGSTDFYRQRENIKRVKQDIYNRFCGSLEVLKNMTNLEHLSINNTDIDEGLEYLSDSIKELKCSSWERPQAKVKKIRDELFLYGGNLKAWKEAHPELMVKARGEKINILYDKTPVKITTVPVTLSNKKEIKENYNQEEINYAEISLRDQRPFSWETNQDQSLKPKNLPIKLYNIKTGKVEHTKGNPNIKSYATLSYVWGSMRDESLLEEMKVTYQRGGEEYKEEIIITKWGKKSLEKAVAACKLLGIDHLWIDQLCINQKDREEKGEEVRKMRKCYGESEVTLISINIKNNLSTESKEFFIVETLKKIVNSEWFKRSWTFQEGWLSKQTIFMFDDCLIDGRLITQAWAILQQSGDYDPDAPNHVGWLYYDEYYKNLNENVQIFITPLGWTYCKNGDSLKEQINLGLSQSLEVTKKRGRGIPIDGVYSILGLLPYGKKVKPKYKERGHQYTRLELDEALMELMKASFDEGHYEEPLSWLGPRRNEPYLWWIPEMDEKGSANIVKSIKVRYEPKSIKLTKNGIGLIGSIHIIDHLINKGHINSSSMDTGEFLDENIGELLVGAGATSNFFYLHGDKKTLTRIKPGDSLVIPNKEQWSSNKPFAILLPGKDNTDCSIDILEIALWKWAKSKEIEKKELFIDMVNKKVIELEKETNSESNQIIPEPEQVIKLVAEQTSKQTEPKIKQDQLIDQITHFGQEKNMDSQIINQTLQWISHVENKSSTGKVNQEYLEEINQLKNNLDKLARLKKELKQLQLEECQVQVESSPKF
ncbi:MAG: hypothetical protein MRERV_24c009 [Mycoplasmataceae bacterium RV_VA103A]|nr:MAG: hypothetical protein MRERV_24c009 [Mycoplasmataceae bacterium RV_VA103A]